MNETIDTKTIRFSQYKSPRNVQEPYYGLPYEMPKMFLSKKTPLFS